MQTSLGIRSTAIGNENDPSSRDGSIDPLAIRLSREDGRGEDPSWTGAGPTGESVIYVDTRSFTRACIGGFLQARLDGVEVRSVASWTQRELGTIDPRRVRAVVVNAGAEPMWSGATAELFGSVALCLPEVPRIVLSAHDDPANISHAFALGVKGYVPTSLPPEIVVEVIWLVCAGGSFAPTSALLFRSRAQAPPPDRQGLEDGETDGSAVRFSRRQVEILGCLHQGLSNKLIAHELSMSENTVKVHIRTIMKKLHATNRTQVVCLTMGILQQMPANATP